MSIIEREQTTTPLPDFETWPTVEEGAPQPGTIAFEAERMDRLFPGWADRIDVAKLDISSPEYCILGQGAYVTETRFFGLRKIERHIGYSQGHYLVYLDAEENGYEAVGAYCSKSREAEWVVEIEKRRTA